MTDRKKYERQASPTRAMVAETKPLSDLALLRLLRIPKSSFESPIGMESARPGQPVRTIGNPGSSGAVWLYASGTVRQVNRADFEPQDGRELRAKVVETQNPISQGESGGPVLNNSAELVAENQSVSREASLVAICIDVEEIQRLLKSVSSP